MARVPLTKEQVATNRLVVNLENVALSEEQFFRLCGDNPELRMELTARKELVIMPPAGAMSSWRNNIFCYRLTDWALKEGSGIVFESSAGYTLPNSALRGPDASWMRRRRWEALSDEDREKFAHACPEFVVELMSPSDSLEELKAKMAEYLANGAELGWLIDPFEAQVYIYRPGQPVECLDNPTQVFGDPVLRGFAFNFKEIL